MNDPTGGTGFSGFETNRRILVIDDNSATERFFWSLKQEWTNHCDI